MIIGISGKISSGKDTIGLIIQWLISQTKSPQDYPTIDILLKDKFQQKCAEGISKWQIKKFAYKVKQIASLLIGIDIEKFEDGDFKNSYLGEEWNYKLNGNLEQVDIKEDDNQGNNTIYQMTVRELLQRIGTDCMRDNLHTNTWVNALFADYNCSCGYSLNKHTNITHVEFEDCTEPNWIITDVRFPNEAQAIKDKQGILIRVNRQFTEVTNVEAQLHPSETALDKYTFDYVIDNNAGISELIDKIKEILIKEKIIYIE